MKKKILFIKNLMPYTNVEYLKILFVDKRKVSFFCMYFSQNSLSVFKFLIFALIDEKQTNKAGN